jgi:hypothetical protein
VVVVGLYQFVRFPVEEALPVINAVALLVGVPVCIAILAWQYATRWTGAGRVVAVALFALLLSLDFWPSTIWYAAQRFASPQAVGEEMATLRVDADSMSWWGEVAGSNWKGRGQLNVPYRAAGLPDGWIFEANSWRVVRMSTGTPAALIIQNAGSVRLWSSSRFLENNINNPLDIDLVAEGTIYGPAERHSAPINSERDIPNVGRCRVDARDMLFIECQGVLRPRVQVKGYWGTAQVLSQQEERSLLPSPFPIALLRGGLGARSSYESNGVVFEVRKPVAYVQRRLELRGVRLSEIAR